MQAKYSLASLAVASLILCFSSKVGGVKMLQIGYSEVDITPPIGSPMAAFPEGRRSPRHAEGVHVPLKAKAIALSDGQTTLSLCAADVSLWQNEDIVRIRTEVTKRCPELLSQHILITATHTHSSVENTYLFGGKPNDPWVQELRKKTVEVIVASMENLVSATLSVGKVEAPFNFNRRVINDEGEARNFQEYKPEVTEGVTDPTLTVLRFDKRDETAILLVHWTAHALTLGPGNRLFSADYPGAMAEFVEERWEDAKVIFINGAAGNQHPKWCMRSDFSALEKVGQLLGEKVLKASETATLVEKPKLLLKTTTLQFPNRADSDLTAEVEIVCLHIDSIVMGFLSGEPFVEFQLRYQEALKEKTALLVGYANGWAGYVPTEEAFAQGGYGVNFYSSDPSQYTRTMLPKGAGEQMLKALLELYGQESAK